MRGATVLLVLLVTAAPGPWRAAQAQEPSRSLRRGERGDRSSVLDNLPGDLRETVVFRYDCASDIGRREVTLFANGTVRLREGPPGEVEMELGELDPEALEGVVARLEGEDLSEAPAEYPGVEGEWVERCLLELPLLQTGGPERFRFSRYASLPLELSRVIAVVDEVGLVAEEHRDLGLSSEYVAEVGDVLRRRDGARFRVVGLTSDGKGVELQGLDVPLTLYLPPDALRERFNELVSRRRDRW